MRAMRKMPDYMILACLILCALCLACNDTDDLHVGLRTSDYLCSDAPVVLNTVALTCGTNVAIDIMEVVVSIGGPTAATDIKGLHFDVVYPRDRFSYVAGSVSIIPDNFLTWGGGVCDVPTNTCTAGTIGDFCGADIECNVPGVNMPAVTASETLDPPADPTMPNIVQGRLTMTIDRTNPADGVGVTLGGTGRVLRFQMRATSVTKPIDPTLFKFENDDAVDPADAPISTVLFNDQLLLWVQ